MPDLHHAVTLLDLGDETTREHVTRCTACKHLLRTPESRALGLGPDGASKLGLTPRRPLRITGVPAGWSIEGQTDLFGDDQQPGVPNLPQSDTA